MSHIVIVFIVTNIVVVVLELIVAFRAVIKMNKQNKKLVKSIADRAVLYKKSEDDLRERVRELEDGVNHDFAVSIRQDITKVICDFNRLEMVLMMAGIYKLIETAGAIEDKESCIILYKKIQSFVDKMEDIKEEE